LGLRDAGKHEEAVFEETGQAEPVPRIFGGPSPGVQQPLDAIDDVVATLEEEVKEFDVAVKRYLRRR
jgi:hypothetical protein